MSAFSLAQFADFLRRELDLDGRSVEKLADARLLEDLNLDSFELFRVLLLMEALLPGFELPGQLALEDVRVCDLHHYYVAESERLRDSS